MPRTCEACGTARAMLRRPKTGASVCKPCFLALFEEEVHRTIVDHKLFARGERVAIAASGGKGG
jgi:cytoplasmic tRNA 2-thiolation protein 1